MDWEHLDEQQAFFRRSQIGSQVRGKTRRIGKDLQYMNIVNQIGRECNPATRCKCAKTSQPDRVISDAKTSVPSVELK